jgi:hypothetical protein
MQFPILVSNLFYSLSLSRLDIPFETESELRDRGTARTPDVLLSAPLGVEVPRTDGSGSEWKVVCWIDSKVRRCLCSDKALAPSSS